MNTEPERRQRIKPLDRAALVRDLTRLGVPRGGLVMVHSSLRSLGHVAGGAETVVDALLETLGPEGTLVVPTFTYAVAREPRLRVRSAAHPVATWVRFRRPPGGIPGSPQRSPLAQRCRHRPAGGDHRDLRQANRPGTPTVPMRQIRDRDGRYFLLGVPYQNLTAVHLCEVELEVPYRKALRIETTMRRADGSLAPLSASAARRSPGTPAATSTGSGQRMEDAGLVRVGEVGNAVARLLGGHDLRLLARELYERDAHAFLRQDGVVTRLAYGHTIETDRGEYCVADPTRMYGAS